jgi:hypothetical protein
MATLTYTFVSRCGGGGHFAVDVSYNGGAAQRVVYTTDEVRAPLSELTQDERERLALLVIKVHQAGKTRQQIVTEFNQGPVTVTI